MVRRTPCSVRVKDYERMFHAASQTPPCDKVRTSIINIKSCVERIVMPVSATPDDPQPITSSPDLQSRSCNLMLQLHASITMLLLNLAPALFLSCFKAFVQSTTLSCVLTITSFLFTDLVMSTVCPSSLSHVSESCLALLSATVFLIKKQNKTENLYLSVCL